MLKRINEPQILLMSRELIDAAKKIQGEARTMRSVYFRTHNVIYNLGSPTTPTIIFVPKLSRSDMLGCYRPKENVIELVTELLADGLEDALHNVFIHEMGHYIDYMLHTSSAHDAEFRQICKDLGIKDGFEKARVDVDLKKRSEIAEKSKKLLALSESPYQEEAASALTKAKELMEKYSISLEEKNPEDSIYFASLIPNTKRLTREEKMLVRFISNLTGTVAILVPAKFGEGNDYNIYGQLEQVETAIYAWNYLVDTAEACYKAKYGSCRNRFSDFCCGFVEGLDEQVKADECTALIKSQRRSQQQFVDISGTRVRTRRQSSSRLFNNDAMSNGMASGRNTQIPSGRTGSSTRAKAICG